jgi:hypothetical protein
MESAETRSPTLPMVLGIVGGVVIGIGSFLNWATASVNWDAITKATGINPPAEIRAQGTVSISGWDVGTGKWMLVIGVVVVIASALLIFEKSAQAVALVVIFGGAVGGSMAVYEATAGKTQRLQDFAGEFAVALRGSLSQYFSVSIGIGIRLCALGGVLAILGGVLAMSRRGPAVPSS